HLGHDHVHDHEIDRPAGPGEHVERLVARGGLEHPVACLREEPERCLSHDSDVIHHEDGMRAGEQIADWVVSHWSAAGRERSPDTGRARPPLTFPPGGAAAVRWITTLGKFGENSA